MSNVIDFTKARERLKKHQDSNDENNRSFDIDNLIIDLSLDYTLNIIESLHEFGFNAENPKCAQDIVLVVEALKGLMHQSLDTRFPTQDLSRIIFQIKDPDAFIEDFFNG